MRVPDCLKEAAMFLGMCLLVGAGLAVTGVIALTGFTVLQSFVNRWLASLL